LAAKLHKNMYQRAKNKYLGKIIIKKGAAKRIATPFFDY
jgi:hypothetical protein